MTMQQGQIERRDEGTPAARGLVFWLGIPALALAAVCGFLWMRYGAQVFVDAALFAWRSCF